MTLSMADAKQILLDTRPEGTKITGAIEYEGLFLFLAPWSDPLEGHLDPFFSVNPESGEFIDFSPQDYENSAEVISLLLASSP